MWRVGRWIAGFFALAPMIAAAWLYHGLTMHPDASKYEAAKPANPSGKVKATFLGTSTLLFDDGETQIMTDGFFTRPDPVQLFVRKVESDPALIDRALTRAGVHRLAAVIVLHSHYDHAMDAAAVAMKTGAVVIGSNSTANVARGGDVPENRILTPAIGEPLAFGKFKVTLMASRHVPTGWPNGTIDAPLRQPARADAYKLGAAYAVLVEHDGRSVLVNGSAGYEPGALAGTRAETVMMGVGTLGKRDQEFKDDYWREVVEATGAKHVVAIHWDNFTAPLSAPLQPLPKIFDDLDASMQFLQDRGKKSGVSVTLPQGWEVFDAFAP